ncbi:MAG: PTS sugar transporter subunit IIA [Spirochaetales bacterium]|uniref:PTS sugar transporter subunit IIA n=1 Tax=Candidatus Thalassospirochaeta sargassi TaxID=3119039 RepID=A0AAJ1IC12_9SPIO|nr:PTS sugar transporter subunit IIA [Spirochaetales bacterium]
MDLANIIDRERCCVLKETTKTEAIIELVNSLEGFNGPQLNGGPLDIEELRKELFYREQLMSTGLSLGLAVPHVRFRGVKSPLVIAGIQPDGITDYDTLDGSEVNIVIMIIVGENQHKQHIRLLSLIASRLKDNKLKQALLSAGSGEEIYSLLAGSEEAGL